MELTMKKTISLMLLTSGLVIMMSSAVRAESVNSHTLENKLEVLVNKPVMASRIAQSDVPDNML